MLLDDSQRGWSASLGLAFAVFCGAVLSGCGDSAVPPGSQPTSQPTSASGRTSPAASAAVEVVDAEALSLAEAGETLYQFEGILTTEEGTPLLCDISLESNPPQCSRPAVELIGAPLDELNLDDARLGVRYGDVSIVVRITKPGIAEFVENVSGS